MFQRTLSGPEIGLIAGTRVALGVGVGLLLSRRLTRDQCKAAGLALVLVGGLSSIPLTAQIMTSGRSEGRKTLSAA